jgi:hypothetical protein
MSIKLNGSSAGSVSFDAPSDTSPSGTDVTLTLPTSAGSALQLLRNSSTAGSLEFADAPILQIVYAETQTESQVTGTTYTDTNLSANITPIKSDSDILVIVWQQYNFNINSNDRGGFGIKILRDSTTIYTPLGSPTGPYDLYIQASGATAVYFYDHKTLIYKDDSRPSGTSQLTYKTQARNYDSNSTIDFQYDASNQDLATSSIVLVELG